MKLKVEVNTAECENMVLSVINADKEIENT